MNIILTENQLRYLAEKGMGGEIANPDDRCEVYLDYTDFNFYFDTVIIKGVGNTPDEREKIYNEIIKNPKCKLFLYGKITGEVFEINVTDLFLTKSSHKNLRVSKETFNEKIFPYFTDIKKFESYINSKNIKKAIELAFESNWKPESSTHVAGVVGILPIEPGVIEWSIVNFFNTKVSVHDRLKLYLVRDYKNGKFGYDENNIELSVVNWLIELFKDVNGEDMKSITSIQLKSILDNFKQEKKDSEKIRDILHPGANIEYSGFGTKRDIYDGIDVLIDNVSYQIKPLSMVLKENGKYYVSIGTSNLVNYSNKPVQRIAFTGNKDKILVFNNKDLKISKNSYEFNSSELIYPEIL